MRKVFDQDNRRLQFLQPTLIQNFAVTIRIRNIQHIRRRVAIRTNHYFFNGNPTQCERIGQLVQKSDRILAPDPQDRQLVV